MDLTPLFSSLQAISQSLRHSGTRLRLHYSTTTIRLQRQEETSAHLLFTVLFWLVVAVVFLLPTFIQQNYELGTLLLLAGLVVAWHAYRKRNRFPDIEEIRLYNHILVDTLAQSIVVEHLHPYFRQQIAKTSTVAFGEVLEVRVRKSTIQPADEDYGEVYLLLTNNTRLYLAEVETMQTTRSIARVLQQVLGLPVEPEPKAWCQF
ncbi:hypothetical protein [Hymenobacter swuensis]|uniref:hypothetical protein n=1 Tax=Hymenobacter swuensis TaxID=1446467 RepID=UPI0005C4CE32|nr:hypothetical protein [Hymenobacter swuensis]